MDEPRDFSQPLLRERLFNACAHGSIQEVRAVLDAGAPVDGRWLHGWTPAMLCCIYSNLPALRALLDAGADPNLHCDQGASAAMKAADKDFVDGLALLSERGACLFDIDRKGWSVMDHAQQERAFACERLLARLHERSALERVAQSGACGAKATRL